MLCEHPAFADAPPPTRDRLAAAWMRRKRFEAQLIALAVGRLLTGAPAASETAMGEADEAFLALAGIGVKGNA